MTPDDTGIDRIAIAVTLVVLLLTVGVAYATYTKLPEDISREDLKEAEDETVTNCDVGPSCGSVELLKIAGVLAVVLVAVAVLRDVWRKVSWL